MIQILFLVLRSITELFEDASHPDVRRNAVMRQQEFTSAGSNRLELVAAPPPPARRQLSAACDIDWGAYGPLLGSAEAISAGYFIFEIVYSGADGQPLLQPAEIQQILAIETAVRNWLQDAGACSTREAAARTSSRPAPGNDTKGGGVTTFDG